MRDRTIRIVLTPVLVLALLVVILGVYMLVILGGGYSVNVKTIVIHGDGGTITYCIGEDPIFGIPTNEKKIDSKEENQNE